MPLPSAITASTNYDADGDDPKQARAQLAGLRGDVETINEHLKLSPLLAPATPLTLGEGLESSGGALNAKLDANAGLARSTSGLRLDATALTAETSADDADLVAVYDDSATAMRKMTRANFLSGVGAAAASQAEMEAASSDAVMATPGSINWHPGVAKFWVEFSMSGTWSIQASHNVLAVVDSGTGLGSVTIDTDFSGADYAAVMMANDSVGNAVVFARGAPTAGNLDFEVRHVENSPLLDPSWVSAVGWGDQ